MHLEHERSNSASFNWTLSYIKVTGVRGVV